MKLCGIDIQPGEKKRMVLPAEGIPALEVILFCGAHPGKTLGVTAGVHGCEYVGVEALRRLSEVLQPDLMHGNVILLPLVNPEGFYAGAKRIVPSDGINLNRAFPGDPEGSASARIAAAIERLVYPHADLLVDLHGGDCNEQLCPLVFCPVAGETWVNERAAEAARVLDVPYRVRSTAKNGLYSWAVQCGIPALLVERGGQGQWSEEEVSACMRDVRALLTHLHILSGNGPVQKQTEIAQAIYEEAPFDGFWYPRTAAGAHVLQGELLGRLQATDGSVYEVRASFAGVTLYYTTALGVHAGDALVAYGSA